MLEAADRTRRGTFSSSNHRQEFGQRRSADDRPWFAIEADGKYIGGCGLFHFEWTARTCEVGIGIGDAAYRGRGYGRDALRVLLAYAFRLRNLRKVWLGVNLPSGLWSF